jgi:hypothetical protein
VDGRRCAEGESGDMMSQGRVGVRERVDDGLSDVAFHL